MPGLTSMVPIVFEAEALREVRPVLVVGDKLHPFEGFGFLLPLGDLGVELGQVGVPVTGEVRLVLGSNRHQALVDVLDGGLGQHRIEHVMGVAIGMHIPFGVVGRGGHLHGGNAQRAIHVAGMADLDAGILAGFQQGGQEGVLAAKAHGNHQVGAVQDWHEAGLHGHAVRVLDARGQAEDLNVIAPNLAREVGQVGEGGDDTDLGGLNGRGRQPDRRDGYR